MKGKVLVLWIFKSLKTKLGFPLLGIEFFLFSGRWLWSFCCENTLKQSGVQHGLTLMNYLPDWYYYCHGLKPKMSCFCCVLIQQSYQIRMRLMLNVLALDPLLKIADTETVVLVLVSFPSFLVPNLLTAALLFDLVALFYMAFQGSELVLLCSSTRSIMLLQPKATKFFMRKMIQGWLSLFVTLTEMLLIRIDLHPGEQ